MYIHRREGAFDVKQQNEWLEPPSKITPSLKTAKHTQVKRKGRRRCKREKPLVIKRIVRNGYIRFSRYPHRKNDNETNKGDETRKRRKLGTRSRTATHSEEREEGRANSRQTVEAVKKGEEDIAKIVSESLMR
jgi:hypothetical protein